MENERESSAKSGLTDRLKQDSRQKIETTKRSAADQIDEVAQAIDRAGAQLDESQPTLAAYASQFASGVGNLATRLRDGSLDDILEDTRQLARRNPAMFLMGGVALGIVLSRFLKASGEHAYGYESQSEPLSGADTLSSGEAGTWDSSAASASPYTADLSGSGRDESLSPRGNGG